MLATSEFVLPDFLKVDEDEIHKRMLNGAPRNYDVSEGALFFDVTKPVAMEKAEMIGFNLSVALQMMFPQFAQGVFLDYHGESIKLPRHPAERSKGSVTVHGDAGVFIPSGTIAMTVGTDDKPPIRFVTTEDGTIDTFGLIEISIQAVEVGKEGNVPADSIVMLERSINGVTAINNDVPTTDGAEQENDEHYRNRILERRQKQSLSGAVRDYIAWAREVEGVGDVIVLPEWDGAGTVKVLITARSGGIASAELIDAVQHHIAPNGRDGGGLAPIGALVTVDTVTQLVVNISFASVELEEGFVLDEVFDSFKDALGKYFSDISLGGLIRHTHVGSLVVGTKGIKDYDGLLLNELLENIQLESGQVAVVGEVTIRSA